MVKWVEPLGQGVMDLIQDQIRANTGERALTDKGEPYEPPMISKKNDYACPGDSIGDSVGRATLCNTEAWRCPKRCPFFPSHTPKQADIDKHPGRLPTRLRMPPQPDKKAKKTSIVKPVLTVAVVGGIIWWLL